MQTEPLCKNLKPSTLCDVDDVVTAPRLATRASL